MSAPRPGGRRAYVLGVTGAVGAGKSTVCRLLRGWGWEVLDLDDAAAAALGEARAEVAALLPAARRGEGAVDRGALVAAIMKDPPLRRAVEALLRPHVVRRIDAWAASLRGPGALEAAILFEAGLDGRCDATLCVRCPRDERRRRVAARASASAQLFDEVEAAQLPEEDKAARADGVVWSAGDPGDLARDLAAALGRLGAPPGAAPPLTAS